MFLNVRQELLSVYNELFSGDPVLQSHAIDRVRVWKCRFEYYFLGPTLKGIVVSCCRAVHRLSTAIECSCELISACLFEEQSDSATSVDQVRLLYSMAVIRFVSLNNVKGFD